MTPQALSHNQWNTTDPLCIAIKEMVTKPQSRHNAKKHTWSVFC